jgi:Tfp pilus assembly protein PilZ
MPLKEMKVLKNIIADPTTLSERFLPGMINGGLFVPGITDLSVGEDVCLWCIFREFSTELHLMGTVFWVRHRTGMARQRLAIGAGVGFKSGQEEQIAYLLQAMEGRAKVEDPFKRKHPRTPLLSPWRCQVHVANDQGSPRAALIVDISAGGVRLVTSSAPLPPGTDLEIGVPWHSDIWHRLQVAWQREANGRVKLGLSRSKEPPQSERDWTALVSQARKTFRAQVWEKSPSSGEPSGSVPPTPGTNRE